MGGTSAMIQNGDQTSRIKHPIIIISLLLGLVLVRYTVNRVFLETSPETLITTPSDASKQGVVYLSTPVLLEMPIEELMEVNIDL
jgi:hypothetical protein